MHYYLLIASLLVIMTTKVVGAVESVSPECDAGCMHKLMKGKRLAQIKQNLVNRLGLPTDMHVDVSNMPPKDALRNIIAMNEDDDLTNGRGSRSLDGTDPATTQIDAVNWVLGSSRPTINNGYAKYTTKWFLPHTDRGEDKIYFNPNSVSTFVNSSIDINVVKPDASWSDVLVTVYKRVNENDISDDPIGSAKPQFLEGDVFDNTQTVSIVADEVLRSWITDSENNYGIDVHITAVKNGQTEARKDLMERVLLTVNLNANLIVTRKDDCLSDTLGTPDANNKQCCRYPLTVNFDENRIDFIISPTSYDAYYCMGTCSIKTDDSEFTSLVGRLTQMKLDSDGITDLSTCCSPQRMAPLKVSFYDGTNVRHNVSVPDMIALDCGCG